MGKSFNDDIFNNNLNLGSINGLNISKEAIEENQEKKGNNSKDALKDSIDKITSKVEQIKEDKDLQQELKEKIKENTSKKSLEQQYKSEIEQLQSNKLTDTEQIALKSTLNKDTYIKKTMIFKQDYLDIIDGLATINNMQIKDVLNQLLEKSINELDPTTREKALKTGRKAKPVKASKNIF